jgi:hypothetical protein
MKTIKHNSFKPHIIAIALAIIFIGYNAITHVSAQDEPVIAGEVNNETKRENLVCAIEMQKVIDVQMYNYITWLDTHFENKSSSSSLLDGAIARYKELQTVLYDELRNHFPHANAVLFAESVEPNECFKLVDDTLNTARKLLSNKAKSTSAVKKTTALIDKYQEINNKLDILNTTYLQMKGYLDTTADKIPCYINESCNKS